MPAHHVDERLPKKSVSTSYEDAIVKHRIENSEVKTQSDSAAEVTSGIWYDIESWCQLEEYLEWFGEKVESKGCAGTDHQFAVTSVFYPNVRAWSEKVIQRRVLDRMLEQIVKVQEQEVVEIPGTQKFKRASRPIVPFERDSARVADLSADRKRAWRIIRLRTHAGYRSLNKEAEQDRGSNSDRYVHGSNR